MKNRFLVNLKSEGKLSLIEPSADISGSYTDKSMDCLKSAKLLLENSLHENSISMSYYAMYNMLIALLFRVGIKCENHGASILLLRLLFGENELSRLISDAKKERIDKQYYIKPEKDEITRKITQELLNDAEEFTLKMKLSINNLDNDSVMKYQERIGRILGD